MCVERDYLIKFHEFIAGDYMARNWIAFNIDKWLCLLHSFGEEMKLKNY